MPAYNISISEAQDKITRLPEQFTEDSNAITVTRHGKPVMTILSFQAYQSLLDKLDALEETLEILQDEELMVSFRKSVAALERGETVAWEDAERELGWA
jgi:antitoxin YefM